MTERLSLKNQSISLKDFSSARVDALSVEASDLLRCSFNGMRIPVVSLGDGEKQSRFAECSFDGSWFEFQTGGNVRFEQCSFRDVRLSNWICFAVEMVGCTFTGQLRGCVFNGTVPPEDRGWVRRSSNEFGRNDFAGADLVDVGFRTGIDLSQQRLPGGDQYVVLTTDDTSIGRVEAEIDAMPDRHDRLVADRLIGAIRFALAGGQRQLFLRLSDYYRSYPPRIVDDIVSRLRRAQGDLA